MHSLLSSRSKFFSKIQDGGMPVAEGKWNGREIGTSWPHAAHYPTHSVDGWDLMTELVGLVWERFPSVNNYLLAIVDLMSLAGYRFSVYKNTHLAGKSYFLTNIRSKFKTKPKVELNGYHIGQNSQFA